MMNTVRNPHRATRLAALALTTTVLFAVSSANAAPPTRTYRITVENLAPLNGTTGQVLSPALVLVHDKAVDLWTVGQTANQAVIDVAEQGNTMTGTDMFRTMEGVVVASSEGTQITSNNSYSFEVSADGDARFLSLVSMLGNTNDAFTGLDAVRLTGGTKTYRVFAYDAGSEVNDQLSASIPGPCCNGVSGVGTAENGVITRHTGFVANTGDLSGELWGWPANEPVALITVERIRE